jgi:glycosyltransferase involved in cell wall biosynthesis
MHVLLLTDSYPNAYLQGQGSFVRDQALCLASHGMQVGVIAIIPISWSNLLKTGFGGLGETSKKDQGVSLHQCCYAQVPKLYRYPIWRSLFSGKRMLQRYITECGKPDVIHVHGFHSAALALWAAKEVNVPLVVTEHNSRVLAGTLDTARLKWAVNLYSNADVCIAVSHALARRLETLSARTVEVVPNVVDTTLFMPGQPEHDCVFLSAGNFTPNKNQLLQLESFHRSLDQMPEARLWLAGDGETLEQCKRYVSEHGLDSRVTFLGRLSREELAQRMQQARVFLISSKHETFGVVAIEAMSCGLHVISTRCGGPEDILAEFGTLTANDSAAFSVAMGEVYQRRMEFPSVYLHEHAAKHFGFAAAAGRLKRLYSHVINQS